MIGITTAHGLTFRQAMPALREDTDKRNMPFDRALTPKSVPPGLNDNYLRSISKVKRLILF
jgi:hypothetical protein